MKVKGVHGWIAILATVIVVDFVVDDGDTISEAFYRARKENPLLAFGIGGIVATHLLFGDHPRYSKYDAFKLIAHPLRQSRKILGLK